ncbi:histidine kinase [Plantibacter sp. Mn2098]|uniref:sensor histidine kinase n=1 Tax=Plantibacter sp. Mn2098 TaxID=3395266 RepID=UPI003BEB90D6
MRTTVWRALGTAPWRFLGSRWPWLGLVYLLTSALLGFALLGVLAMTLLLLPAWGVVVSMLERRRIRLLGFDPIPTPHVPVGSDRRHEWLGIRLTEAATWREVASLIATLFVGWLALAILFAESMALIALGGIAWFSWDGSRDLTLFGDVVWTADRGSLWAPLVGIAIVLIGAAYLNAFIASAQAAMARVLLSARRRELERSVERLTRSRATLVHAFEDERRRIERDLHDGVQQELVALSMRLGIAGLELDEVAAGGADVTRVRESIDAAQTQTEQALASLRASVRGIHPVVLADHGLSAALDELAGRSAIPLVLRTEGVDGIRFSAPVELCAYFFVTEATSNAAKHAAATHLDVTAGRTGGRLIVIAQDDGAGGASADGGTGLHGLHERAATLGGVLLVDSPPGGPTRLILDLPAEPRIDAQSGSAPTAPLATAPTAAPFTPTSAPSTSPKEETYAHPPR